MIVLVGGRGFLAAHTRIALGARERLLVSSAPPVLPPLEPHERWMSQDEFGGPEGDAVLKKGRAVIYLSSASVPGDPTADMNTELALNVGPATRLLGRLAALDSSARFVYVSSGGTVYGAELREDPVTEAHPLAPISPYGLGKVLIEDAIRFAGRVQGRPYAILRVANPVGAFAHSEKQGLVPAALRAVRSGAPLRVFGNGRAERDYLAAADVGAAIVKAMDAVEFGHALWNVGSGRGRSIMDMLSIIGGAIGQDVPFEFVPARAGDVPRIVLDSSRIATDLGWHADSDLSHVIENMWKNHEDQLHEVRRSLPPPPSDTNQEDGYLAALVDPVHYSKVAELTFATDAEAVRHFMEKGIDEGFSPSALFQIPTGLHGPKLRNVLLKARTDGPSSGWFDASYYLVSNPDVADAGVAAFEHFVRWGMLENRNPNSLFDSHWYGASYERPPEASDLLSFPSFVAFGDARAQAPARWLLQIFDHTTATSGTVLERLGRITLAMKPWQERLGSGEFQFMVGLFYSRAYDGAGTLSPEADGAERFSHFLTHGLERGLDPGPLFENGHYKEGANIPAEGGERLIHFLQNGYRHEAPTLIYNDAAYRSANHDLHDPTFWTFRHFVMHGLYEGRSSGPPRAYVAVLNGDVAHHQLSNWKRFWAGLRPELISGTVPPSVVRGEARLRDILKSSTFHESVERACALDPSLGNVPDYGLVLPPLYDIREAARLEIHGRLPRLSYDAIVCAPFLRTGGADLVACLLAEALANDPARKVLLLRTDQNDFERPDWVPTGVDTIDISDVLRKLPSQQAEEYFYSLLLGLGPKQVFNVNSNLCWRTFARYGARLGRILDLYSYLFCWDMDARGNRVGYPSDFYAATAAHLNGIFTDTEYLRDELLKLHRPNADVARRLLPLFSPIREIPKDTTPTATIAVTKTRLRPRILWAGRLDRQKRFDLAVKIARTMPEADFVCWGAAGIDAHGPLGELPGNLALNGAFKSYDELPLDDADAWLFTSAWEGMPTLIIELAVRGVPIVASAVGGVPELIDELTGYPVDAEADAEVYVAALRKSIADPADRVARASRLQTKALARHSRASYVARLEKILRKEG